MRETGAVENAAAAPCQRAEISAVKADSKLATQAELLDDRNGAPYAADGVVRVDEKRRPSGEVLRERAERIDLVWEGFDIRMRHRAGRDQTVAPGRLHVARGDKPDHRRESRHIESGLYSLSAPKREVDQVAPARGDHTPGRLAGDRGLESHPVEQEGLDQLSLGQRGRHFHKGFPAQRDPALGDGPDLAGEAEAAERLKVAGCEPEALAQIAEVFLFKSELLQEVQTRLDAGGNQESPRVG